MGWSALKKGLGIAPGPLLVPITSLLFAGRLIARFGAAAVATAGAIVFAAGPILWATTIGAEPNIGRVIGGMICTGVGVGLTFPTLMGIGTASLPPSSFATGSGVITMIRQAAIAIGVALFVAIVGMPGSLQERVSAKVVVTGSSAKTVEAAKPTLPGVEVVVADQADTQASKLLVDRVKGRYGAMDVLFVNAGVGSLRRWIGRTRLTSTRFSIISWPSWRRPLSQWRVHHIHRLDRRIEGRRRCERLLGNQSGSALSGANARLNLLLAIFVRTLSAQRYRHSDPGQGRTDPRATRRLARKLEATHSAWSHRAARGGGRNRVVPRRRRHLH